jgi:hypothetical protein
LSLSSSLSQAVMIAWGRRAWVAGLFGEVPSLGQRAIAEGTREDAVPNDVALVAARTQPEDDRPSELLGMAQMCPIECCCDNRPRIEIRAVAGRLVADFFNDPFGALLGELHLPSREHLLARRALDVFSAPCCQPESPVAVDHKVKGSSRSRLSWLVIHWSRSA